MSDYSSIKCNYLHNEEIWQHADKIIKEYWEYGEIPVNIEYIIEKGIGLDIIPLRGLYGICGIDAYLKSDFSAIIIDDEKYNDERYDSRLRFSFAHELGHYLLHEYLYKDCNITIETPREYYDFITNFPDREYRAFEYQANEFAGRLLVPKSNLIEEVSKIYNTMKSTLKPEELMRLFEEYPDTVLERSTPRICKPFGVSEDVIKIRVEKENLWPPAEHLNKK